MNVQKIHLASDDSRIVLGWTNKTSNESQSIFRCLATNYLGMAPEPPELGLGVSGWQLLSGQLVALIG